jgi:hypothetical protein
LVVTEPRADLIEAFVSVGGSGPRYAEVALCYAGRDDDARETAHRYFRWAATGWPVMAELPGPDAFAAASRHVSFDAIAEVVSCGPSLDRHLEAINRYVDAGYDHLILTQVGPAQEEFLHVFEHELAPAVRSQRPAPSRHG